MGRVAFRAGDLTMLARCPLPLRVDIVVAAFAGLQFNILGKGDYQRLMDRVAPRAAVEDLGLEVGLMAFSTGRYQAMFGVVTVIA